MAIQDFQNSKKSKNYVVFYANIFDVNSNPSVKALNRLIRKPSKEQIKAEKKFSPKYILTGGSKLTLAEKFMN